MDPWNTFLENKRRRPPTHRNSMLSQKTYNHFDNMFNDNESDNSSIFSTDVYMDQELPINNFPVHNSLTKFLNFDNDTVDTDTNTQGYNQ